MVSTASPNSAIEPAIARALTATLIARPLTSLTTPITELFAHCQHEAWALLLDSGESDHSNSRYHLILRQPLATFTDPHLGLQQCRACLQQMGRYDGPEELPFQGGVGGYLSYDYGRYIEPIASLAEADNALPELALAIYQQALIYDRQQQQYWLLARADQFQQLAHYWQQAATASTKLAPFRLTSAWRSNMSQQQYHDKFERVQQYLQAGDCYQINLAQRFSSTYQGSEWLAYCRLRDANQAPFSAFMRLAQGAILSLSPERFMQVDSHGRVETKPIKGTLPRRPNSTDDAANAIRLQQSPKDRAENLMIVDLLRNDLSRSCLPGSVKVPELFAIESFAAVHHLVSTIRAQLATDKTPLDLIQQAFPGGSITGAPKIRAMQIIEELEPHRRSVYCGSIGYFSQHGGADTNIAIRTLVAAQGRLCCWAGGGLVADSNAAAEYQETLDKVNRILPVLAGASDAATDTMETRS